MRSVLFAIAIFSISSIALSADSAAAQVVKSVPGANVPAEQPKSSIEWDRDRDQHEQAEIRERLADRQEQYIKWLEKNYPEDAARLAALKKQNPDKYLQRLTESYEKYGRLARADKRNPERAKLIRQDIELKSQEEKLVSDIRAASDKKQKAALTEELQQVESKRFDNIVAQKQLRFQELNKRLDELTKELKNKEAELDKLKTQKDEEVKKHITDLLNQTEKMDWD
jgi:hypothetical protein